MWSWSGRMHTWAHVLSLEQVVLSNVPAEPVLQGNRVAIIIRSVHARHDVHRNILNNAARAVHLLNDQTHRCAYPLLTQYANSDA